MTEIPTEGNDFLASVNAVIAEKDAEIAVIQAKYRTAVDRANANMQALHAFEEGLRDTLVALVQDGEDKDMLRSIAESVGISTEVEIAKRVTIEATVEFTVDIFDEIDDYGFEFTLSYNNDEVDVRDSDISVNDY